MTNVHRAQVFRLRLNKTQRLYMAKAAGCARFAYNWALAEWKRQAQEWWDSGKVKPYPSAFALQKQFNAVKGTQFPWVSEVGSDVTAAAILAVGDAFANYRAGVSRRPRFKSRSGRRSFVAGARHRNFRLDRDHIVLPLVGRVRYFGKRRWPEAHHTRAVVCYRGGRWYVAVGYEVEVTKPPAVAGTVAGVDLGLSTPLTVTSDEVVMHLGAGMSQRLNVERRKLRRANKRLHRRQKGSGRHYRAKLHVERVHGRMANIRADVQHKATHLIAGLASRIGVETLAVGNMMRNGRLARAIADVGFYEIKRQLKYKADEVVEADRFYPSSKTCSCCGHVKETLTLADRTYHCDECGFECDRDENAARNLEKMAANCAVSARGAGSPARKRKLTLSSLALKREAGRSGAMK